ncbi:sulfurtransferase complex subunit TusC [Photobacterium sp. OFAV2-7]|uniref:sulfurtransferase complex subunit TusC n=1 Tax=Photobacterium sp. OFAV2-7 TaxID=2917748 RepID=UPI001EF64209|nr:sulfurtransferase complex subunit TusC [Photobacterium sp. OFAV2-7]MCG7585637.1 sulfurtransferase complex subunit TusC [Photobacterium sp. OFAV2-7]
MKSLGFVFQSAPHGSSSGREGLDAVLATSAYSEDISLFFIGDGVFQLLANQQPGQILCRDYIATFKMLDLYDVENIYVCRQSLSERCLEDSELVIEVDVVDQTDITTKLHQCQRILSF